MTNGIILGNQTLVLQAVNTHQAGLYTCVASNVVADGESNALLLDIKCKAGGLVRVHILLLSPWREDFFGGLWGKFWLL